MVWAAVPVPKLECLRPEMQKVQAPQFAPYIPNLIKFRWCCADRLNPPGLCRSSDLPWQAGRICPVRQSLTVHIGMLKRLSLVALGRRLCPMPCPAAGRLGTGPLDGEACVAGHWKGWGNTGGAVYQSRTLTDSIYVLIKSIIQDYVDKIYTLIRWCIFLLCL